MSNEELVKRLRNAKLEKELNICRMAQVVMKNGIAEAEAYAEELEGDLTELCRQLLAAEDKLAKAVELLRKHCDPMDMSDADVATLAEIEGEQQ